MLHITAAVRLVAARDTPGKKMWQGVSTAGILSDLDREESVNRGTRQRIVDTHWSRYREHNVCSNRAATRVKDLTARENRDEENTRFYSNFANSGNLQQPILSPFHGGGQGSIFYTFGSPSTHLMDLKPKKLLGRGRFDSNRDSNPGEHPATQGHTI